MSNDLSSADKCTNESLRVAKRDKLIEEGLGILDRETSIEPCKDGVFSINDDDLMMAVAKITNNILGQTTQEPVIVEALETLDMLKDCIDAQTAVCVHRPPLHEKIDILIEKIRSTLQGESKPETETAKTRLLKLGATIPDTYRKEAQETTAHRAEQWYARITDKEAYRLANEYDLTLPHHDNLRSEFLKRVTLLYMVR